jgi:Na+-transporting NADH:ubiquinone oxidoreductase subunit C
MAMSTGYIIGFASAICVVCAVGVAGASMGLRSFQEANETKAFQQKVLAAVDLPAKGPDGRRPALDIEQTADLFAQRLELVLVDQQGNEVMPDATDEEKLARVAEARAAVKGTAKAPEVVPLYKRMGEDGQTVEAYALEMKGKGLWGPISGYLALKPDGKTVLNVAFDAPKETPGLGAEIMNPPFKEQWAEKSIADAGGELKPISVVKGSAELACKGETEHCVDGVSGATITCRGVDDMVEEAVVRDYAPYLKKIQTGA